MISRRELALELESAKPWRDGDEMLRYIEAEGWLRDPAQALGRTTTDSELRRLIDKHLPDGTTYEQVFMLMADIGHTVVPDPEPTNKDQLAKLIDDEFDLSGLLAIRIADHLDAIGVKAPGGNDE